METAIAARLRDQLGTAKSANEMFNIFSRYNALFVRPHIRGAIKEYQSQLIQKVKDDIEGLHQKFKVQKLPYIVWVLIFEGFKILWISWVFLSMKNYIHYIQVHGWTVS